jgi:hypothetical protein
VRAQLLVRCAQQAAAHINEATLLLSCYSRFAAAHLCLHHSVAAGADESTQAAEVSICFN